MLKEGAPPALGEFLTLSPEAWAEPIDRTKYDFAWSLIHFFAHAADARYADAFAHFMQDVSTGGDPVESFVRRIGPINQVEKAWREYWPKEAYFLREARIEVELPESDLFAGLT